MDLWDYHRGGHQDHTSTLECNIYTCIHKQIRDHTFSFVHLSSGTDTNMLYVNAHVAHIQIHIFHLRESGNRGEDGYPSRVLDQGVHRGTPEAPYPTAVHREVRTGEEEPVSCCQGRWVGLRHSTGRIAYWARRSMGPRRHS